MKTIILVAIVLFAVSQDTAKANVGGPWDAHLGLWCENMYIGPPLNRVTLNCRYSVFDGGAFVYGITGTWEISDLATLTRIDARAAGSTDPMTTKDLIDKLYRIPALPYIRNHTVNCVGAQDQEVLIKGEGHLEHFTGLAYPLTAVIDDATAILTATQGGLCPNGGETTANASHDFDWDIYAYPTDDCSGPGVGVNSILDVHVGGYGSFFTTDEEYSDVCNETDSSQSPSVPTLPMPEWEGCHASCGCSDWLWILDVLGAIGYEMQYSLDGASFTRFKVLDSHQAPGADFYSVHHGAGDYYWRFRAFNDFGVGGWSDIDYTPNQCECGGGSPPPLN